MLQKSPKNRSKVQGKTDIVCDTVKKCNSCSRIITGKFIKIYKTYVVIVNVTTAILKYVGKDHKCFLKKVKAKGRYCTAGNKEPCKSNHSI